MAKVYFPIILGAILSIISLPTINGDKILVVAPTMLANHFEKSLELADILVKDQHEVHILVLNSGGLDKDELGEKLKNKMDEGKGDQEDDGHHPRRQHVVEKHHPRDHGKVGESSSSSRWTHDIFQFEEEFVKRITEGEENPHKIVGNKWMERAYDQNETILRNEAFHVYQEFLESEKSKELMKRLKAAGFSRALFDTWDFGAQLIFFLLDIPKIVAFNKISLLTYQMEYAGTFHKNPQLPVNVPEVYATHIGDGKPSEERRKEFRNEHEKEVEIFEKVHREMMEKWFLTKEKEFKQKFEMAESKEWPKTMKGLYERVEKVFVDSHPGLDFPLGNAKSANVEYFGGINLSTKTQKDEVHGRENANLVIVSLDYCEKMLNHEENLAGFRAIICAFREYQKGHAHGEGHSHAPIKFQIDCDSEEMNKMVEEGGDEEGNGENLTVEKIKNIQATLADKHTRLLITNCSSGQAIGALWEGVPLVCVPMMVDQFYISEAMQLDGRPKVATTLDINGLMKVAAEGMNKGGGGGTHQGNMVVEPKKAILDVLQKMLQIEAKDYLSGAHKLQLELRKTAEKAKHIFLKTFETSVKAGKKSSH